MRVLLLLGCFTALASSSSLSCRHSNYTDTTSPNRMKLGLYGVDNTSWTTAANRDTANVDSCPTWAGDGGFYHSASTSQSVAMVLIARRTTSVQVFSHSFAPTYAPSNASSNVPSICSLRDSQNSAGRQLRVKTAFTSSQTGQESLLSPLSSTTSVGLNLPGMLTNTVPTSLSLWPLAFLCAASQSLGVRRPAIGLLLALGLSRTEAQTAPCTYEILRRPGETVGTQLTGSGDTPWTCLQDCIDVAISAGHTP